MLSRYPRSARAMLLGGAATLGLLAALSWPAPAQTPEAHQATPREGGRTGPSPGLVGSSPPKSKDLPAAPENKLTPDGQILLQRRRAEVRDLEAAWASKLQELEQHLSGILPDAKAATSRAEAAYQDSKLKREIAEIAFKEYAEGIYLQDKATILGEIRLAESDLARPRGPTRPDGKDLLEGGDYLEGSSRVRETGF